MSKEEKDSGEMTLEEFETLGDQLERSSVDVEEILDVLEGKALTATAVGEKLGIGKYPTIYGRLERLASKGQLSKRYKDKKRAYYSINPDYDPDAEVEDDEEDEV